MGEPMTIDEARRVAGAAAIAAEDGMTPLPGAVTRDALATLAAEVDRLTAAYDLVTSVSRSAGNAASNTLAAEVDRLRSLPVIETCGQCASERYLGHAGTRYCGHRDATGEDDETYLPSDEATPPPSWCPLRGKAGGR